jgi:hypothetical protein
LEKETHLTQNTGINGPPQYGVVQVVPRNGSPLTTYFTMYTSSWIDDSTDLPLSYDFSYQTTSTGSTATIQSKSADNQVSNYLPKGYISGSSGGVMIISRAYDIYNAYASTSITCYVTSTGTIDVSSFLTSSLSSAGAISNPDQYLVAVNLAASSLNTVNCSTVSSTYCNRLNRADCANTADTCGSCLSGYFGNYGDGNTLCRPQSSLASLQPNDGVCKTHDDCVYSYCNSNGICQALSRTCPTSISSQT